METKPAPFVYDRSELFGVTFGPNNRRAFLTPVNKFEIVVGARVLDQKECSFYWYDGVGFLPVEMAATLVGLTLTLCDVDKVPFVENLPLNRINSTHLREQSILSGSSNRAGMAIPLKMEPRICAIGASYVADYRGDRNPSVIELFYLNR